MADKIRELAEKLGRRFAPIRRPHPIWPRIEEILRAELKPLLDAATNCISGKTLGGVIWPQRDDLEKLAAELEGWATQRGGSE